MCTKHQLSTVIFNIPIYVIIILQKSQIYEYNVSKKIFVSHQVDFHPELCQGEYLYAD